MLHVKRDPRAASDLSGLLGATLDFEAYVIQGQVEFSEGPDSRGHHTKIRLNALRGKGSVEPILLPDDFLSRRNHSGGSQIFLVDCLLMGRSSLTPAQAKFLANIHSCDYHFMLIEHHEGKSARLGVTTFHLDEKEAHSLKKTRLRIRLG